MQRSLQSSSLNSLRSNRTHTKDRQTILATILVIYRHRSQIEELYFESELDSWKCEQDMSWRLTCGSSLVPSRKSEDFTLLVICQAAIEGPHDTPRA